MSPPAQGGCQCALSLPRAGTLCPLFAGDVPEVSCSLEEQGGDLPWSPLSRPSGRRRVAEADAALLPQ